MALDVPAEHHETDILIVGGGAAGTMAAFECAEAGIDVIQATKGRAASGTTTVARGGFAAAMGKDDSPELHLREILQHGGELIDPELAKIWVYDIIDVVKDLRAWGAEFVASLPLGGLDGTLADRLNGDSGPVRGKTGHLRHVASLSGLLPAGARTLVFSILVNGARGGQTELDAAIDRFIAALGDGEPRQGLKVRGSS